MLELTWEQVRAYGQAADRARIRSEKTLAQLIRAGALYEPEQFAEFLKE